MNNSTGKRILLVEDEAVITLVQTAVLKKSGYIVTSASSGVKAIDLVKRGGEFDLILMDIDLGSGIDGTEAAQAILKERDIPILFLSSHTETDVVEKTEGITSYGYVVKNSGDTVLLASIKMAFRLYEERTRVQEQKWSLQSLNEELEAANEELNAAFEELEAANEELIQTQHEILKSEERYHRLFTSNNDGICIHEIIYRGGVAVDYRILDVNPVYEMITGLKRWDVQGKLASEVYGTGYPPYLDLYSSVAETEEPMTFDTYFEPMDRYFHISVFSPGKGMFATVFKDETDRVRNEMLLKERELKFRTLFETLNQGIVYHDTSGRIIDANSAAEKILGLSHEQLLGREAVDPRWKTVKEDYSSYPGPELPAIEALETGSPVKDRVMGVFNPIMNEYRWIIVDAHPEYREGEDSPYRVYAVFTDITERRAFEKVIGEQRQFLDAVVSAIPAPVFFKDENGRYTGCNEAFLEYIGLKREDVINKTVYDISPPELAALYHESDRRIIDSGGGQIYEAAVRYADGSLRQVMFHKAVMHSTGGEIKGIVGVMLDITDIKKIEDDLRRVRDDLESALREKEYLLRELQHRVKNNLAMISGLISLESVHSDDNKTKDVLQNLRNRIDSLEKLYSSLYHTGDVADIRLDNYISGIAASIKKTYISEIQKINLVTDLDPIVVSIKQAASIGLITNELLVNVLKYAFPESMEGVITISLKESGSGYELAVTDNGVGLPEGFNVKNTTGSGLMIVDMLAEHMDGTFTAGSGEFTSFRVTIPSEDRCL